MRLLAFGSRFLNAGSGASCITTPETFISDIDFWARFQPRSTDGGWEGPGNLVCHLDTDDVDVPLGLGTREMGPQKAP